MAQGGIAPGIEGKPQDRAHTDAYSKYLINCNAMCIVVMYIIMRTEL